MMRTTAPGLDRLEPLLQRADAAGVRVEVAVVGAARPLPGIVERGAGRILRDALAAALRSGGARAASVAVEFMPGALAVEVCDDRGRAAAPRAPAHLVELAAALGGGLVARRAADGVRVRAWLPTEGWA